MITDIVMMPGKDYQAICDAVRAKTGGTELLKSGDIPAQIEGISGGGEKILYMDAELLNAGGAYPADADDYTTAVIPEGTLFVDYDTFQNLPNIKTLIIHANCEFEDLEFYNSSTKAYVGYNALENGNVLIEKLVIGGEFTIVPMNFGQNVTTLREIVLEEGVTQVQNYAFINSPYLRYVTIPASVTAMQNGGGYSLPTNGGIIDITIRGYAGTYAETYAANLGYTFEVIE